MDRKWIFSDSRVEYLSGVNEFLDFAFRNDKDGKIPCPCAKCVNRSCRVREEIYDHLVLYRMMEGYDVWYCHGESLSTQVPLKHTNVAPEHGCDYDNGVGGDMMGMVSDMLRMSSEAHNMDIGETRSTEPHEHDGGVTEIEKLNELIKDIDKELYPGCKKYNRLSYLLHLYNIKCRFGWSNKSFDVMLKLLKNSFPEGDTLPSSYKEAKKIIEGLGLTYVKIHACPNDCMLFWKEHAKDQECCICHASRWKVDEKNSENNTSKKRKKKQIPAKVLRYFPLKPRLQRLFMTSKIAEDMTWHAREPKQDGVLKHPSDSEAWKTIDNQFPDFGSEPRNVRLGLASDGFNPFGRLDSKCSIWPVVLIPYNLPPWLCMKKENFILSLIIPGPKAPRNDIDVYLQPLIEELNDLWKDGVSTYDASSGKDFQMHAALLWTINDFPALGNFSGWNIYSEFGCPSCNVNYSAKRLHYGHKFCFMDHQRFVDDLELCKPPSGSKVLHQLKDIEFTLGKLSDEPTGVLEHTWKKKSIFFNLPYWEFNLVRHNLDVMHTEKNVCDNIIYTLLPNDDKSKDNLSARRDLKRLKIRKKLWPQKRASGRYFLPPAPFHLSKEGRKCFFEVLKRAKFPDGYASNISRCVQKYRTLSGLKSHDCHVLMQCLLPLALRGNLDDRVASVLVELCGVFRVLCGKTLYVHELDLLQGKVARILSCLEKIFVPSFFTISVHLVMHMIHEAKVAGPVHYRWMYPVERYLKTLKSFVRNQARPEGSIAEAYLADECLTFCSRYLKGADPRYHSRNNADSEPLGDEDKDSSPFPSEGSPYGRIQGFRMEEKMLKQTHRYVLFNCEDANIDSLKKDHIAHISRITRRRRPLQREKERLHSEGFGDWLNGYVNNPDNSSDQRLTGKIKSLARGPNHIARRFTSFDVANGYRFRTTEHEKGMNTQNSGVMVVAKTQSYASSSDTRPMLGDVVYYGRVNDIIELDYYGDFKVVLLACDWVDVVQGKGIKKDALGCTLVSFQHLIHTGDRLNDEPFVFPSQVQQVIYVQDPREPEWSMPIPMKRRDTYDVGEDDCDDGAVVFTVGEASLQGEDDIELDIDDVSLTASEGLYVNNDCMESSDEDD